MGAFTDWEQFYRETVPPQPIRLGVPRPQRLDEERRMMAQIRGCACLGIKHLMRHEVRAPYLIEVPVRRWFGVRHCYQWGWVADLGEFFLGMTEELAIVASEEGPNRFSVVTDTVRFEDFVAQQGYEISDLRRLHSRLRNIWP